MVFAFLCHSIGGTPCRILYSAVFGDDLNTETNQVSVSSDHYLYGSRDAHVTIAATENDTQGASASGKVEWVYGNETRSLSRFHVGCKANTDSESPARTGFKGHRMTLQTSE